MVNLKYGTPQAAATAISPIFKADSASLHVSREKDGKLRLVYAGWDDAKVVQPDGCGATGEALTFRPRF